MNVKAACRLTFLPSYHPSRRVLAQRHCALPSQPVQCLFGYHGAYLSIQVESCTCVDSIYTSLYIRVHSKSLPKNPLHEI